MDTLFDLSGKRALVTGGAQGLGRMIAEGLLRAGACVAITSRKQDALDLAMMDLGTIGPVTAFIADLSTPAAAVELAEQYRSKTNGLDILVNNAGKTWGASFESFPDKAWPGVMAVNVQTPFRLVQELLPELTSSGKADSPSRIINIGSVAGKVVERLEAYSYVASKAATHHLTRQMAAYLAPRHITVNAVLPGYFPTSMTAHLRDEEGRPNDALAAHIPLGRLGRSDDIAGAIVFLCSRAGAYMTGTELIVDGGVSGCR